MRITIPAVLVQGVLSWTKVSLKYMHTLMSSILTHTLLCGFHMSLPGITFTNQNAHIFFLSLCYNWWLWSSLKNLITISTIYGSLCKRDCIWNLVLISSFWFTHKLIHHEFLVVRHLRYRTKSLDITLESCTMSPSNRYKQYLQVIHLGKITNFITASARTRKSLSLSNSVILNLLDWIITIQFTSVHGKSLTLYVL